VAELADALGSGSSGRKAVRVQIPPSAPKKGLQILYLYFPLPSKTHNHVSIFRITADMPSQHLFIKLFVSVSLQFFLLPLSKHR
jgi:hypothetical protein